MKHFITYHKAEDRGAIDRTNLSEEKSVGSKKSVKFLESACNNRIWLIEGQKEQDGKMRYSLAYSFIANRVEERTNQEEENAVIGSSVIYFEDERLNEYDWFKELLKEQANFSLGFQATQRPTIIQALETHLNLWSFKEENVGVGEQYIEGERQPREIEVRSRSEKARRACVAHWGVKCYACGFDFGRFYGGRGDGFIEVHHRKLLSSADSGREVNPIDDLIPLCANCHRIVHLESPPLDVDILRAELAD
jgi:hypothetical protein